MGWALGIYLLGTPALGQEPPKRSAAWEMHCVVCHGVDGKANTDEGKKKGAKNLADARWQATVSDARLEGSVKRGRDKMPAFGKKLTDPQIKSLVEEIRTLVPPR
jgi:cytochrome c oxidase cbb3-type subunit 3